MAPSAAGVTSLVLCLLTLVLFHSSWTNRLIKAKDHASVQINVGEVNDAGLYTGEFSTFALCGYIRFKGQADEALSHLVEQADESA